MRYFTKKIWLGMSKKESAYWDNKWKENINKYTEYINKISSRIPKRFYTMYKKEHLNGDNLIDLKIENKGKKYFQKETNEIHLLIKKNELEITINLLCPSKFIYTLKYGKVKGYTLKYPSDNPVPFAEGDGIGSWGYDELELLKDGYLKHEIMFHSGTIIIIVFKIFGYTKKNI